MKKIILIFIMFFMCLLQVSAGDYAKKENIEKYVDAKYYCYYNATGLESDNYNVIVGISKDYKTAYADIVEDPEATNGPGTEPIANWIYEDDDWDSDLDSSFSAKQYYDKNGKCPEVAYIHYYPFEYVLYLVPSEKLVPLQNTFSYTAAKDNEDSYYLVDMEESKNVKMSCEYSAKAKSRTDSSTEDTQVNFKLNFNESGKVINSDNLGNNVLIAPEIGVGYKYVGDTCPNLYMCNVKGSSITYNQTTITSYEYWLYYADYGVDSRKSCKKIQCTNTSESYCKPSSLDSEICPIYHDLYNALETDYDLYKEDIKNNHFYKKSRDYLISYCRNVLSNLDAENPCAKLCLKIKDEEIIKNISFNNKGQCGFSWKLINWIANIVKWVKYIVPVIVIVMGILDFIKAISNGKEDEMKKAQGRFIKRLIAAALIFIIPFIIEFILNKMGFAANGCGIIDL